MIFPLISFEQTGKEIHQMFPNRPYLVHGGMVGVSALVFVIGMNFPSVSIISLYD